jgi:T5SS/PEP-CTERM-associated repeat protein
LGRALSTAVVSVSLISAANAAVTPSGDVDPDTDPTSWGWWTTANIGVDGTGSLQITDGDSITSGGAGNSIGYGSGATGMVTVDGVGSAWRVDADLIVGDQGDGTLDITSEGSVTSLASDTTLGFAVGAVGRATVSGNGSQWNNSHFYVGDSGQGQFDINQGGLVDSTYVYVGNQAGSQGRVTVTGAGSTWNCSQTQIGVNGFGTLRIEDAATVTGGSWVTVGDGLNGEGEVTLDGVGSSWTASYLSVGGYSGAGQGTVSITNGATLTQDNSTYIGGYDWRGAGSRGDVTVTGAGSTWNCGGAVYVGRAGGQGTLSVSDGGVVTAPSRFDASYRFYIGGDQTDSDAMGQVTVDGAGSSLSNLYSLHVGTYQSTGTLRIANGGHADFYWWAYIGDSTGAMGSVIVEQVGSTLIGDGHLYVGLDRGNGALQVAHGASVVCAGSSVGYFDDSVGRVTINGAGSTWRNTDDVWIGRDGGSGILTITDDGLVVIDGQLSIGSGADGDNGVDMSNGGMLAITGNGAESLDDFLLLVIGTDAIRYWDESASDWALLTDATRGIDYTLEYITTGDLAGYTLLTVTAVPEPATLGLLALGGLALIRRRRAA